ncbi:hypothetical protein JTE90_002487 [Oedothorax gibbosus]|uniref:Uncharacterized protein n=1 Tax=Oedothorax gibbosus TaxID=931172 RepID=A0AAV6TU24_9ARAC|nr:hypothetical protein JTE90_002487 [Oedothorax gibbosus]
MGPKNAEWEDYWDPFHKMILAGSDEYIWKRPYPEFVLVLSERGGDWSDVIAPRDKTEIRGILTWLRTSVASFTGFLFLFSVHDGDHIHVLHDCAFSNGTCRCRWRQQSRVAAAIRRRLGRKSIFVRNVGQASWIDLLTYYIFQQGIQRPALFLGGAESPFPLQAADVRYDGSGFSSQLVEAQVSRDGCGLRGELAPSEDATQDRESLLEKPPKEEQIWKSLRKDHVIPETLLSGSM